MTLASRVYPPQSLPDLRELVARYWGEGKRSGRAVLYRARWRSDDDTPSFAVYADGYKDFGGSGEAGGVIQWVMREFGHSYREAIAWLEKRDNYTHNAPTLSVSRSPLISYSHSHNTSKWQHHLHNAIRETQRILWSPAGTDALNYLRQERKLSDQTIRNAGLGYALDYVKTNYVYQDEGGRSHQTKLPPGIVIPWEINGVLWAVRVRTRTGALAGALGIPEDRFDYGDRRGEVLDKYRSVRGSRTAGVLYGAEKITPDKKVVFFEGEFDALLAQQHLGDQAACVTFGSASSVPAALPEQYRHQLETQDRIYVVMDADQAGQSADGKMRQLFPDRHVRLTLPDGHKDLTDFARAGGEIREWFATATRPQIPDSWITGLLHLKDGGGRHQGTSAPVYYALASCAHAGLVNPERFTLNELLTSARRIGIEMRYDLVRDGTRVLLENELLVKFGSEVTPESDPNSAKNPPRSRRSAKVGRPSEVYGLVPQDARLAALTKALAVCIREKAYPVRRRPHQLPTVADLEQRSFTDVDLPETFQPEVETESIPAKTIQRFERRVAFRREGRLTESLIGSLHNATATPFPEGWAVDTLKVFRISYLRALKLAGRVGCSLDEVSQAVGISRDTVNKYVTEAGFDILRDQSVVVPLHEDEPVERQVRSAALQVRGKPLAIEIVEGKSETEGDEVAVSRLPYTAAAAQSALACERQVRVRYQTANRHVPLLDVQSLRSFTCKRSHTLVTLEGSVGDAEGSAVAKKRGGKKRLQMQKRKLAPDETRYGSRDDADDSRKSFRAFLRALPEVSPEDEYEEPDDAVPEDYDEIEDYEEEEEEQPRRKAGYSREWVEGQIRLRLELLGFLSEDETRYISPKTGEVIPYDSDLESLVRLLVGRPAF